MSDGRPAPLGVWKGATAEGREQGRNREAHGECGGVDMGVRAAADKGTAPADPRSVVAGEVRAGTAPSGGVMKWCMGDMYMSPGVRTQARLRG